MSKLRKVLVTSLFTVVQLLVLASVAFAADGGAGTNDQDVLMWRYIAAGFGIAVAAFGGALGQGKTAAAALEGIARNPGARADVFVPFILGLALIESLVIYALVIAFMVIP